MERSEQRGADRVAVRNEVEFFVDADIIKAASVDISETGLRMLTERPILIRMRMYHADGGYDERVARLVWAAREGEQMGYGFEFQPDPDQEE